jgi:hypothetical protein
MVAIVARLDDPKSLTPFQQAVEDGFAQQGVSGIPGLDA